MPDQQIVDHATPIIFRAVVKAKLDFDLFKMKLNTTYQIIKFVWMIY
jgi:hypothetical protein